MSDYYTVKSGLKLPSLVSSFARLTFNNSYQRDIVEKKTFSLLVFTLNRHSKTFISLGLHIQKLYDFIDNKKAFSY